MRSFTIEETAFLAWVYGEIARMSGTERFDTSVQQLAHQWQELTGQELSPDFHDFAVGVHGTQ